MQIVALLSKEVRGDPFWCTVTASLSSTHRRCAASAAVPLRHNASLVASHTQSQSQTYAGTHSHTGAGIHTHTGTWMRNVTQDEQEEKKKEKKERDIRIVVREIAVTRTVPGDLTVPSRPRTSVFFVSCVASVRDAPTTAVRDTTQVYAERSTERCSSQSQNRDPTHGKSQDRGERDGRCEVDQAVGVDWERVNASLRYSTSTILLVSPPPPPPPPPQKQAGSNPSHHYRDVSFVRAAIDERVQEVQLALTLRGLGAASVVGVYSVQHAVDVLIRIITGNNSSILNHSDTHMDLNMDTKAVMHPGELIRLIVPSPPLMPRNALSRHTTGMCSTEELEAGAQCKETLESEVRDRRRRIYLATSSLADISRLACESTDTTWSNATSECREDGLHEEDLCIIRAFFSGKQ